MIEPWQKINEEPYNLEFRQMVKRTYKLPNGQLHNYDILKDRQVSVILALTPDNKVVMTRQFRPGPEKILLEMPAGIVDEGESPEEAAKRELLEETGYTGELEYIGPTYRDAYSTIILQAFIARNCQKIQEPHREDDEFIEVELLTLEQFHAHARSGQFTDVSPAYLGLDHIGYLRRND